LHPGFYILKDMLEGATEILALADALRTPLLRLHLNSQSVQDADSARIISEHALRDIDAFITSYTEASLAQVSLEPLSLGSILVDTQERLKPYARLTGTSLLVDDHSSHQLVLGNAGLLRVGLELITKTICDFASDTPEPAVLMRADTRNGYPRLGVYREDIDLSASDVALAKKLIGGADVNAGLFHQLGALRVIIAGRLLEPLGLTLRSAKADGNRGLALQLRPSTQASLFGV
jgi:hypothetical protein